MIPCIPVHASASALWFQLSLCSSEGPQTHFTSTPPHYVRSNLGLRIWLETPGWFCLHTKSTATLEGGGNECKRAKELIATSHTLITRPLNEWVSLPLSYLQPKNHSLVAQLAKPTQSPKQAASEAAVCPANAIVQPRKQHSDTKSTTTQFNDHLFSLAWGYNSESAQQSTGKWRATSDGLLLTCLARIFFLFFPFLFFKNISPNARWALRLRLVIGGCCCCCWCW